MLAKNDKSYRIVTIRSPDSLCRLCAITKRGGASAKAFALLYGAVSQTAAVCTGKNMELEILHWFESLHNPVLNYIMYFFTCLGEAGILWILLALGALVLFPKKYRKTGVTMAFALILSLIMCNFVMKNMFHRIRPFVADTSFENLFHIFDPIDDWSFPSGHTSASFAAAVAMLMWNKKEGAAALVAAVCISISRLYLTVHYPTDVLASVVLGSLYGIAAYFIVKAAIKKSEKFRRVFAEGQPYKTLFLKSKE